jgi:short-subunit dehydrogenase
MEGSSLRLDQMRVVLTGASGGIGSALAQALLQQGAHLLLVSRSAEKLQTLQARLGSASVSTLVADITQAQDRAKIVATAISFQANVLINNAGVPSFGALQPLPPEQLEAVLHTNLLAPILLTQGLLPHLTQQAAAHVLNIGSVLGQLGLPGYSVYCASKFGLRGFSEALRRELQFTPVRVQYLGPRATQTTFNDAAAARYQQHTGTHTDTPQQVAQAALRLLQSADAECFLGFPEKWAVKLNALAPQMLDRAFRSHTEFVMKGE